MRQIVFPSWLLAVVRQVRAWIPDPVLRQNPESILLYAEVAKRRKENYYWYENPEGCNVPVQAWRLFAPPTNLLSKLAGKWDAARLHFAINSMAIQSRIQIGTSPEFEFTLQFNIFNVNLNESIWPKCNYGVMNASLSGKNVNQERYHDGDDDVPHYRVTMDNVRTRIRAGDDWKISMVRNRNYFCIDIVVRNKSGNLDLFYPSSFRY